MLCSQIQRSVERLFGGVRLIEVDESARPKRYVFEVGISGSPRLVVVWRSNGTLHVERPRADVSPA